MYAQFGIFLLLVFAVFKTVGDEKPALQVQGKVSGIADANSCNSTPSTAFRYSGLNSGPECASMAEVNCTKAVAENVAEKKCNTTGTVKSGACEKSCNTTAGLNYLTGNEGSCTKEAAKTVAVK